MITKIVKEFCDRCYTIRALYKEYSYLYEDNKERFDLLDKTAHDFFYNLQTILIDRIFLDICKIPDEATKGKNDNFTIKYILKEIEQDVAKNLGLNELSKEIHEFRNYVIPARHKIIAHFDRDTIMSNKTLGAFPKHEGDKFWKNLQEFVNKIHSYYFEETFIFDDVVDCTYNAKYLIRALKKAAYFDQYFKGVLHSTLLEEKEFKYRNV